MRQRKHIKMVFNNWSREKSSMNREKQLMMHSMQKHRTGEQGLAVYRAELDQGWDGYQTLLKNIEALKAQVSGETEQDQELTQKIRDLEAQAQETKQTLDAKEQDYQTKKNELDAVKQQLTNAKAELDQAKAQLDASETKLSSAVASIESGQKQLDAGKAELEAQEQTLKKGEAEIAENEAKLADARKEYEDGKKTSEAEIAKGEKKLADAGKQISQGMEIPMMYMYGIMPVCGIICAICVVIKIITLYKADISYFAPKNQALSRDDA